jgi:two-component system response regulator HydG
MNVLIVENDGIIATVLEKAIKMWGYDVKIAETGKDALESFKGATFHVVILSLSLPDMAGIECITQFKCLQHTVGIIVISDDTSRELEIAVREQGILDYMIKPVDVKVLQMFLAHLAQKQAVKEGRGSGSERC